jgi:hypothetical protein
MRTDCLALITTAAAGIRKATDPRKTLARIWVLISNALDGDIQILGDNSSLIWLPAHTAPSAIGEAKRSDGARVTHIDWRANRLGDGLAKQAAAIGQPPSAVVRLLTSAYEAVRHAARLLAAVTYEANNHKVHEVDSEGNCSTKVVRDSQDKPRSKASASSSSARLKPLPLPPKERKLAAPWTPASVPARAASRGDRTHRRRAAALEEERLRTRVQEVGDRLRPSSARPASERLAELKARVLNT